MWQAADGDRLGDVFLQALEEFRSRYRLQYEPQGVKRGGWHRLQVQAQGARTARSTRAAATCTGGA